MPTFFKSSDDFHKWLDGHHALERELLVGFYRKETGRGISYPEALDEALAFGWIDGVRKRLDEGSYSIRFTPRKPSSIWSAINIKRVEELIAQGRMMPSGLQAFHGRDQRKTLKYSYEREQAALTPEMQALFKGNKKAASFFEAQPPGYKKTATFWVMAAKKEETRARRFAHLIERSADGARIDLLKPSGK